MPARLFTHVLAASAALTLVVSSAANAQDSKAATKKPTPSSHVEVKEAIKKPSGDSAFAKSGIDVGLVVSGVEKSRGFYKNTLGLKELAGFDVPENVGADAGLRDNEGLHVHVLAVSNDPDAAKLKLLSFKKNKSENGEKKFIHTETGFRYITLSIVD